MNQKRTESRKLCVSDGELCELFVCLLSVVFSFLLTEWFTQCGVNDPGLNYDCYNAEVRKKVEAVMLLKNDS